MNNENRANKTPEQAYLGDIPCTILGHTLKRTKIRLEQNCGKGIKGRELLVPGRSVKYEMPAIVEEWLKSAWRGSRREPDRLTSIINRKDDTTPGGNIPAFASDKMSDKSNEKKTVFLPDGYRGDVVECEMEPLMYDGDLVKLRVAGSHMIRWARIHDLHATQDNQRLHNER